MQLSGCKVPKTDIKDVQAAAAENDVLIWTTSHPRDAKPMSAANRLVGVWETTLDCDPVKIRPVLKQQGVTDDKMDAAIERVQLRLAITGCMDSNPCISAVLLSPDGRWIAVGRQGATSLLWDLASGQPAATLTDGTETLHVFAFSANSRMLAGGDCRALRVWTRFPSPADP